MCRGMSKRERLDAWSKQHITMHKTHLGLILTPGLHGAFNRHATDCH